MDTFTINEVIKPHQKNNIFKGVFPCDLLPKKFSLPAIFIINLSPHNEPGSHWVAVYISPKRSAFYFDSFGFPVKNCYIRRFLEIHSIKINYNRIQLQHVASNKCGKFCCAFAISILKHKSILMFISKFCKNLFVNDIIIENLYNHLKQN